MALSKLSIALFCACLPACYISVAPAILTLILFIYLHMTEQELGNLEMINQRLETLEKSPEHDQAIAEMRSELNALQLRAGMKIKA